MFAFEIGGRAITPGAVVLALVIGWIALGTVRHRPRTVGGAVLLVVAGQVVAAVTSFRAGWLDAARRFAARAGVDAFFFAAGTLDAAFAAARRAIGWGLDTLAATPMPGAESASVLAFVAFLAAVLVVSALVCGTVILIARSTAGAPLGAWLASLGVVFGALGVVLTWLPVAPGEMTAIHAVLVAAAVGCGYLVSTAATGVSPTAAVRERIRTRG